MEERHKGQPSKEEIEQHMIKYKELRQLHEEVEKALLDAREKEWKQMGMKLKKQVERNVSSSQIGRAHV